MYLCGFGIFSRISSNLDDDKEFLEIYKDCMGGTRICGRCKRYAAEHMRTFLMEHQEKREIVMERLQEFRLKY